MASTSQKAAERIAAVASTVSTRWLAAQEAARKLSGLCESESCTLGLLWCACSLWIVLSRLLLLLLLCVVGVIVWLRGSSLLLRGNGPAAAGGLDGVTANRGGGCTSWDFPLGGASGGLDKVVALGGRIPLSDLTVIKELVGWFSSGVCMQVIDIDRDNRECGQDRASRVHTQPSGNGGGA